MGLGVGGMLRWHEWVFPPTCDGRTARFENDTISRCEYFCTLSCVAEMFKLAVVADLTTVGYLCWLGWGPTVFLEYANELVIGDVIVPTPDVFHLFYPRYESDICQQSCIKGPTDFSAIIRWDKPAEHAGKATDDGRG